MIGIKIHNLFHYTTSNMTMKENKTQFTTEDTLQAVKESIL